MEYNLNHPWKDLEELVRREPKQAVAVAFVGGFFLCLLPLAKLVSILVRVLFLLLKPALLILGVVKVIEYARAKCGSHES
jgi:hypothetical protein